MKDAGATLVSGSFVGGVPGTGIFVAVVAAKPAAGATSRPIRVYVCDGRMVNEWLAIWALEPSL